MGVVIIYSRDGARSLSGECWRADQTAVRDSEVAAINFHLQCFVVQRVDCVPLDAGLPFALTRLFRQEITFDIAEITAEQKNSQTVFLLGRTVVTWPSFLTKCH